MEITFLIGNGFDLMMGLKTSYPSFVNYYLHKTTSEHLCVAKFKKQIEANINNWADAELAFGKYTSNFPLADCKMKMDT